VWKIDLFEPVVSTDPELAVIIAKCAFPSINTLIQPEGRVSFFALPS